MATLNYLSDAGSSITAEMQTHKLYLGNIGDPDELKQLKYLYIFATPLASLRCFIAYDSGDWELLGSINDSVQRFDLGAKRCHYVELKFTESSSSKSFDVDGYLFVGDRVAARI